MVVSGLSAQCVCWIGYRSTVSSALGGPWAFFKSHNEVQASNGWMDGWKEALLTDAASGLSKQSRWQIPLSRCVMGKIRNTRAKAKRLVWRSRLLSQKG